jgi:curved DNA-binding protein
MLGGEVVVASPKGGKFALTVPAETPNGKIFRLTSQGMPRLNLPTQRGDMYVKVDVTLPTNLSAEERDLYEHLKQLRGL